MAGLKTPTNLEDWGSTPIAPLNLNLKKFNRKLPEFSLKCIRTSLHLSGTKFADLYVRLISLAIASKQRHTHTYRYRQKLPFLNIDRK